MGKVEVDLRNQYIFKTVNRFKRFSNFENYIRSHWSINEELMIEDHGEASISKFLDYHEKKNSLDFKENNKVTPSGKHFEYNPRYEDVTYYINKHNRRGKRTIDTIEEYAVVCNGCSMTFGVGSYQEEIWPSLCFGEDHINLGVPGDSAGRIIRTTAALLDHKQPKAIVLLLPTLNRIDAIFDHPDRFGIYEESLQPSLLKEDESLEQELYIDFNKGVSEYFLHLRFLNSLELIIQKCKKYNVKLYLGSWCKTTSSILEKYEKRGYTFFEHLKYGKYPKSRDGIHTGLEYHKDLTTNIMKVWKD